MAPNRVMTKALKAMKPEKYGMQSDRSMILLVYSKQYWECETQWLGVIFCDVSFLLCIGEPVRQLHHLGMMFGVRVVRDSNLACRDLYEFNRF